MSYGSSGNYCKSHKSDHKSAPCENASVESRYVLAALVNCNDYPYQQHEYKSEDDSECDI